MRKLLVASGFFFSSTLGYASPPAIPPGPPPIVTDGVHTSVSVKMDFTSGCIVSAGTGTTNIACNTGTNNPAGTTHAIQGNGGAAAFEGIGPGTNGQLLLGQTGAAALFEPMSGDATIAASGSITVAKIGGVSVSLGGAFTTTGTGAATLVFGNTGYSYTFPSANANLNYKVGNFVNGDCLGASGTAGGISDQGFACLAQGNIGMEIDFYYSGQLSSTNITATPYLAKSFSRATTIPSGAQIKCVARAGATNSNTVTLYKETAGTVSSIGTLVFAASGSSYQPCAATFTSSVSFAAGDLIEVDFTSDTTLANVAISIPAIQ